MPEDAKPKKVYDELLFGEVGGHPLLVLKCWRDDCWLNGVSVKEWQTGNLDYAEVSAAVVQHQFQHLGATLGKFLQGLK